MALYSTRIVGVADEWNPYERLAEFSHSCSGATDSSPATMGATGETGATGATGAVDTVGAVGAVGAVASFVGLVRGVGGIQALILEHYPKMTESALHGLVTQAQEQWQLTGCLLEHRVGQLPVGAPIVLVACASPHRAEALAACQFLMDRLKTNAPFWKREVFADGTEQWVVPRPEDQQNAKG